ncbi:recombination protein O N-terminal domain-containing protein [Patescibacteria group bacterium]|nr:recombination protein O N-terminal domain-containing protein [Patescibacteria group bacterium]
MATFETYTTEAIVCGSFSDKEHDRTLRLFTKEGGMLYARAGGTRAHISKLRYGLQDFSYAKVTLVRGRSEWRVIGAVALDNFYYKARTRAARAAVLAGTRSLSRFVQGGGRHPELFTEVVDGMYVLGAAEHPLGERVFLLRLLSHLGYVSPHASYARLLSAATFEEACICVQSEDFSVPVLEKTIENALTLSHL